MKKNKFLLALSAAMLLASCGGNNSSSAPAASSDASSASSVSSAASSDSVSSVTSSAKSDSSAIESSDDYGPDESSDDFSSDDFSSDSLASEESSESLPVEEDWSAEAIALMKEHLYGVVLPYFYLYEATVSYDAEYDVITLTTADSLDVGELEIYADVLDEEGWDVTDISVANGYPAGVAYRASLTVNTEEGDRHLDALFYTVNDKGAPATSGRLYFEVGDPYLYDFPEEFILDLISYYFDTEILPPEFEADFYEVSERNMAVYCYTDSLTALADYTAALKAAGWTVLDEADEDGYWTAVSPDGSYAISFKYDESYGDLDIYFGPSPLWPSAAIAAFLEACELEDVTIPAFTGDGLSFQWSVGENWLTGELEGTMVIYGVDGESIENYCGALTLAGYDVEYDGESFDFTATLPLDGGYSYVIDGFYYATYGAILITLPSSLIAPLPTEWPADDLAAFFGEEITDVLPPFSGEATGYELISDFFGDALVVTVGEGKEDDALATYIEDLTKAGYVANGATYYGDPIYDSPNGQIRVDVYTAGDGTFTIELGLVPSKAWPSEQIAGFLGEGCKDTVPAYNSDDVSFVEFEGEEGDDYARVMVYFDEEDDAEQALADYMAILSENGYGVYASDIYGDPFYATANKEVSINLWLDSDYDGYCLVVDIYPYVEADEINNVAAYRYIATSLKRYYGLSVPVITDEAIGEGAFVNAFYGDSDLGDFDLMLTLELAYASADAANAALEAYKTVLAGAGYTYSDSKGAYLIDTEDEFVYVSVDENFHLIIKYYAAVA